VDQLKAGEAPEKIVAGWPADLAGFEQLRRRYFLYK